MKINSVTGPVDTRSIGRTLFHEHVFLVQPGSELDPDLRRDQGAMIDDGVRRLGELRETQGVRTLVDPTPIELGRNVSALAEVSRRSGVTIVSSTGFYHEPMGIPAYWRDATLDQIVRLYRHDIVEGVMDSKIRCGVLKCATGEGEITAQERKMLTAASLVHRETGVPIITHTTAATCGDLQLDIFEENGVDPGRVVVGHCCESTDLAYLRGLVERGAFIGFDRIGWEHLQSDEIRADNLATLIREGWGGSILLSQDRFTAMAWQTGRPMTRERSEREADRRRRGEHPPPYTYLLTGFARLMSARGVDMATLAGMIEENPRRFLSGEGPARRGGSPAQPFSQ